MDGEADTWPSAYLAILPAGPIHTLDPTGYLIWCTAVDVGEETEVIAEVCVITGETAGHIGADVTAFLGELVRMGLLKAGPES